VRPTILPAFVNFPTEAAIIGRLLAGYADLEIGMLHCVSVVRDDFDTALKVMFRDRGETRRVNIADALGRQHYASLKLETEFSMAIGAVRHCLSARNLYAHCNWYDDNSGQLAFVNLEELAKEKALVADLTSLDIRHTDVPTLQAVERFFVYTDALLIWVNYEGRHRAGKMKAQPLPKPPAMKEPPLSLP